MSHNKIKVGGQSPNSSSEVTLNLNNLNGVSSSTPTDKGVLKYNGSEWASLLLAFPNKTLYYRWSKKDTGNYGTSKFFDNGDAFVWIGPSFGTYTYLDSSVSEVAANTTDTPVGSAYKQGVTLGTAGTYLFIFGGTLRTGSCDFQLHDGTSHFGVKGRAVGDDSNKNNVIFAVKTVTASTTIKAIVSNVSSAGVPESENANGATILIYKIG
jgi:hypothetical protein